MKEKQPVFGPLFISFAAIIIIIRSFFFISGQFGLPEPEFQINGIHIHHYLFGIAILFLVAISAINQKFSTKTHAIFLGISLAMIVDELQYLVKLAVVRYPAVELDTISLFGLVLLLLALNEKYELRKKLTIPKFSLIAKIALGIIFWIAIFGGPFGIEPIKAEMKEEHISITRYIPHVHMYYAKNNSKHQITK